VTSISPSSARAGTRPPRPPATKYVTHQIAHKGYTYILHISLYIYPYVEHPLSSVRPPLAYGLSGWATEESVCLCVCVCVCVTQCVYGERLLTVESTKAAPFLETISLHLTHVTPLPVRYAV
jgi:hypothetical protein